MCFAWLDAGKVGIIGMQHLSHNGGVNSKDFIHLEAGDPRLEPYCNLPDRAMNREGGRFVCEGRWLVERLLASPFVVESILLGEGAPPLEGVPGGVPVYAASKAVIEQSIGYKFHRGALAVSRRREALTVTELIDQLPDRAVVTVLVGVCDPDNVGAIVRTSAAMGAAAVLVDGQTHDLFYRRALRAAMGTTLFMPIALCEDIHEALTLFRGQGVQTVATVARGVGDAFKPDVGKTKVIGSVRPADRAALLFGTEGPGLSDPVIAACDEAVTIPMHAQTDSLNVGAAAAVFLYEWLHPRK